jgi:hypothetical protein
MCLPSLLMILIMQRRAAVMQAACAPHHVERELRSPRCQHKTALICAYFTRAFDRSSLL